MFTISNIIFLIILIFLCIGPCLTLIIILVYMIFKLKILPFCTKNESLPPIEILIDKEPKKYKHVTPIK